MRREGYLFEQVVAMENLLLAARKTFRGKKDKAPVARFYFHLETELVALQAELRSGRYQPRPLRAFVIYEPKRRKICAAEVRDRVVHHALCHVLDPLFERSLIYDTYACRVGKGTHAAVRRAQQFARRHAYFLKCDVRRYFETIDHAVLKALLRRRIKDARVLSLLDQIIDQPIPGGETGRGLPIGNLTSQYFANLYLGQLDHLLKDHRRVKGYLRYMDDFLLFGDDKPTLYGHLQAVRAFLQDRLCLELKEEALRLAPVTQGMPFLGFRIFPGLIRLGGTKWAQFRRGVRRLEAAYQQGDLDEAALAARVACRVGHVVHADTLAARRNFFEGSLRLV